MTQLSTQSIIRPTFVADNQSLREAARLWSSAKVLALDTEFMRTDTFYPKFALLQICDGEKTWLIDPLGIDDLEPIRELLVKPDVIKVLHSCSEDLEVFRLVFECLPQPLYDTQVAAAMTGHGFSSGYSKLVKSLLGIELGKHETRSNWLQRPLSDSQCQYAAEDVYHLLPLYRHLQADGESLDRKGWLSEEMENILVSAKQSIPPEQQYRRIKGAGRLDRHSLAALQVLASWREKEARDRNKPRGHIVADRELLEIARHKPANKELLAGLEELRYRVSREYGEKIVEILATVSSNSDDYPEPFTPSPGREVRQLVKSCRERLIGKAESMAIAPEVLAKRAVLEDLARSWAEGKPRLPEILAGGWRREAIGNDLLHFIEQAESAVDSADQT